MEVLIYYPDEETTLDIATSQENERVSALLRAYGLEYGEREHPATYMQRLTTFFYDGLDQLDAGEKSDFLSYYNALKLFINGENLYQWAHETDVEYVARLTQRFRQAELDQIPSLMADMVLEIIDQYDPMGHIRNMQVAPNPLNIHRGDSSTKH